MEQKARYSPVQYYVESTVEFIYYSCLTIMMKYSRQERFEIKKIKQNPKIQFYFAEVYFNITETL